MKLEFLEDRYAYELERKEKLTAALTLPVGILSGLGSLLAVMARSFTYKDPVLTGIFTLCLSSAVVAFFVCLIILGRAYHAQSYVYLPLLGELEAAEDEFRTFGEEEGFKGDFRKRIIAAADQNTENNERRSKGLYWARVALFWLLGLMAFAGVPYVQDQVRFHMPTQDAPKPGPAQPASTPQRPSFPQNRVIKEGRDPQIATKK